MDWYYQVNGEEFGPVKKRDLQVLINNRTIDGETPVRREGEGQWQPLAEMVRKQKTPSDQKEKKPAESREITSGTGNPPAGDAVPVPPPKGQRPIGEETKANKKVPQEKLPFAFTGSGSEYFKIWIVNAVLSVVTLGIYSAWAKVRRKQYFYGNTRVGGSTFHYLADPVKILKGRIVVVIGFVLMSLVNQFFPLFGTLSALVFLPLLPWFVVRSLTFNARNSAIRNIRFNFHGTYLEALKVFVLWPLLIPLTLGLIGPYLLFLQKRYIVENSSYGKTRFSFSATPGDYYAIFLKLLFPFVLCVLAAVGVGFLFGAAAIFPFAVFYLYAMAFYLVKANNLLFNTCRFAENGFRATMELKDFLYILVTNTIGVVLTLGFFHPFAQVRTYQYRVNTLSMLSSGDLERFVADEQEQVSAVGDEVSDFMDFDIGL